MILTLYFLSALITLIVFKLHYSLLIKLFLIIGIIAINLNDIRTLKIIKAGKVIKIFKVIHHAHLPKNRVTPISLNRILRTMNPASIMHTIEADRPKSGMAIIINAAHITATGDTTFQDPGNTLGRMERPDRHRLKYITQPLINENRRLNPNRIKRA